MICIYNTTARTAKSADYLGNAGYNRWFRWSKMGVFARILLELVRQEEETELIMMDATYLKAHRTASSLRKKGGAVG